MSRKRQLKILNFFVSLELFGVPCSEIKNPLSAVSLLQNIFIVVL